MEDFLKVIPVHCTGPDGFRLLGLPVPEPGKVLGVIGPSGTRKLTVVKLLAGILKPDLGRLENPPDWEELLAHFQGTDLHNYLASVGSERWAIVKPVNIEHVNKALEGRVDCVIEQIDDRSAMEEVCTVLELNQFSNRYIKDLPVEELQRFTIAFTVIGYNVVKIFDEPSTFLDVRQKLKAAEVIRSVAKVSPDNYVIVVDHYFSFLEYVSDDIFCLYG